MVVVDSRVSFLYTRLCYGTRVIVRHDGYGLKEQSVASIAKDSHRSWAKRYSYSSVL